MHVFVYGTLKRGFPNFEAGLGKARFLAPARTLQRYPLYIQGRWFAPALLPEPGRGRRILGELFDVVPATLAVLDAIEGVGRPGGFERYRLTVERLDSGALVSALAYVRRRQHIEAFHSGLIDDYQDDRYLHRSKRPGRREC